MKPGYGIRPASSLHQNVHSVEPIALSVLSFLGFVLWPQGRCGWGVSVFMVSHFISQHECSPVATLGSFCSIRVHTVIKSHPAAGGFISQLDIGAEPAAGPALGDLFTGHWLKMSFSDALCNLCSVSPLTCWTGRLDGRVLLLSIPSLLFSSPSSASATWLFSRKST